MDLNKLKTSEGCTFHSKVPETVTALEDLVLGWCQQIEQVRNFNFMTLLMYVRT